MIQSASRHLVNPELTPMLELFPTVALAAEMLPVMRGRPAWLPVNPADREQTTVVEQSIPGPPDAPAVPVRI